MNFGGFVPPPVSLRLTAFTMQEMVGNMLSGVGQGCYIWTDMILLLVLSMSSMAVSGTDVHDVSTAIVTVQARYTHPGPWRKSMRPLVTRSILSRIWVM